MYIGIKGIIIIADHSVCPDRKVQTHLKRTYLPFLSMFPDHFPGIYFFRCPQFINRIIHTVKMPLCIRAFLRGTLWRIKKTQLLFGCNGGHFKFQAFLPQNTKSLLCYCSCDRLSCKVKSVSPFPSPMARTAGKTADMVFPTPVGACTKSVRPLETV